MAKAAQSSGSRMRGIDRVVEILEVLREIGVPTQVGQIAARLNAPRSSIYEVIGSLAGAGILEVNPGTGEVFFGLASYFYGAAYARQNPIIGLGAEEVNRLGRATGETAELCTLIKNRYAIVHSMPGNSLLRMETKPGFTLPVPWTASGRLLVAHMSREEVGALVPPEDFDLPNGVKLSLDVFYDEVRSADAQGLCVTSGILDTFTKCIAVPIRSTFGQNIATLCFVVPVAIDAAREETLVAALRESQRRLSQYPASILATSA
ncbi:IclR family transcriptional regulator [Shinella zoogloeoides]|nr:IclR family transcriptional regulator [Shinella zoogloeoides]